MCVCVSVHTHALTWACAVRTASSLVRSCRCRPRSDSVTALRNTQVDCEEDADSFLLYLNNLNNALNKLCHYCHWTRKLCVLINKGMFSSSFTRRKPTPGDNLMCPMSPNSLKLGPNSGSLSTGPPTSLSVMLPSFQFVGEGGLGLPHQRPQGTKNKLPWEQQVKGMSWVRNQPETCPSTETFFWLMFVFHRLPYQPLA